MAELSPEGRDMTQTLCILLYLCAGFFIGLHFFATRLLDSTSPEWVDTLYGKPQPIILYIGAFLLVMAVVLHLFFAWRYAGQFDTWSVLRAAVYFTFISGLLFGLPLLLVRTALPPDTREWIYREILMELLFQPSILGFAVLSLLITRIFRNRIIYILYAGPPDAGSAERRCSTQHR